MNLSGDYSFTPQQKVDKVDEDDVAAALEAPAEEPAEALELNFKMKEYNGWRISYRTLAPEAKTIEKYRPLLRKNFLALGKYFAPGSQRSKARLSLLASSVANKTKLRNLERNRKQVSNTCKLWLVIVLKHIETPKS